MAKSNSTVRPGERRDLMAITRIYNHYVVNTHYTFDVEPHKVDQRRAWFGQFADDGPYRLLVAEADGNIVGFVYSTRLRPKAAYDSSVETTVYVDHTRAGKGAGKRLYEALFDALKDQRLHRAYAGIALPNKPSIALHERLGFKRVGVFNEAGWKFGRYWDIAWYQRSLR